MKQSSTLFCLAGLSFALSLLACGCSQDLATRAPAHQMKATVLATIVNLAYEDDVSKSQSMQPKVIFSPQGDGVAYLAAQDGKQYVVHNGRSGVRFPTISHLAISPDGRHVAHDALLPDGRRRMFLDEKPGEVYSDVWPPAFSPDSRHLTYIAQKGKVSYLVIDGLQAADGHPSFNGDPVFAADSRTVAFVLTPAAAGTGARLVICDLQMRELCSFICEDEYAPLLSRDRSKIALVEKMPKGVRVKVMSLADRSILSSGPVVDAVDKLTFGRDDSTVLYVAARGKERFVQVSRREVQLPPSEAFGPPAEYGERPDVALFLKTAKGTGLYRSEPIGFSGAWYDEAGQLVYDRSGKQSAFCARKGKRFLVVVNGKESPKYDMVISPAWSPDGSRLVFRARQGGKRFLVVMSASGAVVRQNPPADMVFETTFTADGRSVAYGAKQGNRLEWRVEPL